MLGSNGVDGQSTPLGERKDLWHPCSKPLLANELPSVLHGTCFVCTGRPLSPAILERKRTMAVMILL